LRPVFVFMKQVCYTTGVNRKFLYATAVLVGSMVGVGIFGLPYTFAQAGYWPGIILLAVIGCSTLLVDLMFGEVILRTHQSHELMGYGRFYLGPTFQKLLFFSSVLLGYVGLLAYIIISGEFLNTLLSPFFFARLETYSIFFAVVLSFAVWRGIKAVSHIELFFSGLFVVVMAAMAFVGVHAIHTANYMGFNRSHLSLPYGVLLFAFGGLMSVPIQRQLLVGQERKLGRAIALALLFTALLYIAFTTLVVGISGAGTTPDAVSGLYEFLGTKISILSAFFGIFAITTSFLMVSTALISTFHFDFKVKRPTAWLLTVIPPLFLYLVGIRTFVGIISLAGGVALALEQILVVFLYAKAKAKGDRIPEYSLNIPTWLLYILIGMFSAGIVYFLFIK
jgi:tyrosine-specific transport protein